MQSQVKKDQIWKNKNSGNQIKILRDLGQGKWWVEGKLDSFKIRDHLIHDNYELTEEAGGWRNKE